MEINYELFSHSVVSDSLWFHGLQHKRLPCPSLSPRVCSTHVHWVSGTIQPSHPLSPPSPPAFNLSQHQCLFKWVNSLHQVAKYWSFIFSISPSNEYSGLISFRIDWFDLLAVQGTLKSLLQHHSSETSVLWHSAFFRVQLSHLYMTTENTIALTIWTFVVKVMSLLFNMLSRMVIARERSLNWLMVLSVLLTNLCPWRSYFTFLNFSKVKPRWSPILLPDLTAYDSHESVDTYYLYL